MDEHSIIFNKTAFELDDIGVDNVGSTQQQVHIYVQQRNARKTVTTISHLSQDLDLSRILKSLRKRLCCNGSLPEDSVHGTVIQLQGDHRQACVDFLVSESIVTHDEIVVHGA